MSSHVIYLPCSTEGCTTTEPIYTGDVTTEQFPDSGPDSFEGVVHFHPLQRPRR